MLFYRKHTKHILKYHLVTAELLKRSTIWTRQGRDHSILQYVTLTLDVYQVCHCVGRCIKITAP